MTIGVVDEGLVGEGLGPWVFCLFWLGCSLFSESERIAIVVADKGVFGFV